MLIYAMLAYIVDVESNNDDVTDGFTLSSFGASEIQQRGDDCHVGRFGKYLYICRLLGYTQR